MDQNDRRTPLARRPFLLNFVRAQREDDLDFRYDPGRRLNVNVKDGVPVVGTGLGKARLKTLGVAAED
jgi:hypothetical protein